MRAVEDLVDRFVQWAREREDVVAAALLGSRARGDSRDDSDVDLIVVTRAPDAYVTNHEWIRELGRVTCLAVEKWGAVTSVRARYDAALEVDLGVTSPDWARTDPVDAGTARVVSGGFRILLDRDGLLERLVAASREIDRPMPHRR